MRKQLSQPSFVNGFARSKGESVRPDLWFDVGHWVPRLGNQGASLFDVSQKQHGTLTGASYVADYMDCGTTSNNYYASCPLSYQIGNGTIGFPTTWFIEIMCVGSFGSYGFVFVRRNGSTTTGWQLYTKSSTNIAFIIYCASTSGYIGKYSSVAPDTNKILSIVVTYDGGSSSSGIKIYIDGIDRTGTDNNSGTFVAPEPITNNCRLGGWELGNLPFGGRIYQAGIASRVLSESQIMDLAADHLLPLRRKKQWSMYVPTTGGVFKPYWCQTPTTIGAA